jgi:hypothetical protein
MTGGFQPSGSLRSDSLKPAGHLSISICGDGNDQVRHAFPRKYTEYSVSSTAAAAVTCGSDRVSGMATLVQAPEDVVAALERKVVDTSTSLPEKYRVLFSLRNVAGTAATKALITGGWVACAAWLCLRMTVTRYMCCTCRPAAVACCRVPYAPCNFCHSSTAPASLHMHVEPHM